MQKFSQKVVKPSTSMKRVSAQLKAEVVDINPFSTNVSITDKPGVGFYYQNNWKTPVEE